MHHGAANQATLSAKVGSVKMKAIPYEDRQMNLLSLDVAIFINLNFALCCM
jgi:hypothetical protein